MKKVAILQSNYIPWKGYFDIINMVDEFILYDDMHNKRIDDATLVALTLLIAESRPEEKDTMIKVVVNLIGHAK